MTASIATNQTILVVGGGISGMTAALEAAECGKQVILVEKTPVLGGRTARLYRYFPKMCHPTCGLEINLRRIKQNRNIRLMTMTEVTAVSGSRGNYSVTLKVAPRFVNENCTACGKCAEAVTTEVSNPWNYGLDKMKAAYLPHNMAHPQRYVIDPSIVGTPEGEKAKAACPVGAVDLDMKEETVTLSVGAVIYATGWRPYDAAKIQPYGYGRFANVITSLEFERLADPQGGLGPLLAFTLGRMPESRQLVLHYRVRVGVGAQQGDGVNRAQGHACSVAASVWANVAPGGSVSAICVCDRSSGGMKAPGILPCLLYTSPSPRDGLLSRMPSSA